MIMPCPSLVAPLHHQRKTLWFWRGELCDADAGGSVWWGNRLQVGMLLTAGGGEKREGTR